MILDMFTPKRVYLDYAAATPLAKGALKAMRPWLTGSGYGNPSAIHKEGVAARVAVEEARLSLARTLGIRTNEIIFTGSGTEANNLAIAGSVHNFASTSDLSQSEVITTAIEHPSVTKVLQSLQQQGLTVHHTKLDDSGIIDTNYLQTLLNKNTTLVTFSYANSEVGVIQPVRRISRLVRKYNQAHGTSIKIHVDGAQAPLWLSCDVHALGVDMLSLDAGKCFGPKGVGILAKLAATEIKPVQFGGGQEAGLRAGTENVAGIIGAAVALQTAQADYKQCSTKVAAVRDAAIIHILKEIPNAVLNGTTGTDRLANNINISIPGLDTEFATVVLDKQGFAVSTKSACAGAGGGASTVVTAITGDPTRAASTLRISLGPDTKLSDLKRLAKVLKEHLEKMHDILT